MSLDLDAIRNRSDVYGSAYREGGWRDAGWFAGESASDVPDLVAEVERLTVIADAARAYVAQPDRPEGMDPNDAHEWDCEAERRYLALQDAIQEADAL
ncbi:hypothetical protein [Paractinoplanes toevensis]|uniref:Uncharacterized protein n=1 Tax=Paractinoplanes toevensis TaxID=571911 RepID=A0A919VYC7_9ACTN|nr:hypothetical protein [Actinoplanes toevensis]GIM88862.1 hypothetical protein Ato02nite_006550 [Actinoplanes toevensis]